MKNTTHSTHSPLHDDEGYLLVVVLDHVHAAEADEQRPRMCQVVCVVLGEDLAEELSLGALERMREKITTKTRKSTNRAVNGGKKLEGKLNRQQTLEAVRQRMFLLRC